MMCKFNPGRERWLLVLSMLPVLWSCGIPYDVFESGDSAPGYYVDIDSIPDAVPRNESRSRYGNPTSYYVFGKKYYVMNDSEGYVERGVASWYGTKFHGRKTSSGEIYDTYGMTAAHKSLPLPTYVRVTNLRNHKSVIVKVNDRGPFVDNRLIDLSYAAAKKLDITGNGTGHVEVRVITPGKTKTFVKSPPVQNSPNASHQDPEGSVYIQVAAFQDHQNAKRLRNKLEKMPISEINILEGVQNQKKIYRVRIGPVANLKLADELTELLSQRGLTGTRIVTD
jgi:rare lipoprotein A